MAAAVLLVSFLLGADALSVPAQSVYPDRGIEMVVTFPPGGPTDTAARIVQPALAKELKVPVVLVNKGGSGGAAGMDFVAKARPDGYTIAATVRSTTTITPAVQANVPYRLKDFEMIGAYAASPQAIVAKKGAPWRSLEELIADARKRPATLTYGSAGQGTNSFFTMELLKLARGLDITHVPFGGSGPLKTAILGGHVQLASVSLSTMIPVIKSGDVVGLVISGARRNAAVPDVPTMAEKGVAEASLSTIMELYAPARTPPAVIERLAAALAAVMMNPETSATLEKAGLDSYHFPPEASRQQAEREYEAVLAAAKRLGLAK
ncbi:MAG TPA: tripartite tricarboxylate transporter substrate binding protein [Methylomirabilota bacterium]|nr:tripartite tricarboxylate transporter substrate binding protein [Methylomirabilota bacterium]